MKECNIVNDLLPLYADELASPDSVEFIRRHTAWCKECSEAWKRISTRLPEVDPREEANNYRKAIRRGKFKIFLKSLTLCLLVLVISVCSIAYTLYCCGYLLPIETSYPAPDGTRTLQIMERNFFLRQSEGYMIRFHFEKTDYDSGGHNRYYTQWDAIDAHWAPDSQYLLLDVVTVDGVRELRIVDTTIQMTRGGLSEIPGLSENLIPELTRLCGAEGEVFFAFDSWLPDSRTITFLYTTTQGQSGIGTYRCSDDLDSLK